MFVCMFHGLSFTLVQMKLLELQDLVMRLVRERNEWYSKYVAAAQNPELLASQPEGVLPAERRMELNATDGAGKQQPGQALGRGSSPWSQPCVWMGGVTCLPCLCSLQGYERSICQMKQNKRLLFFTNPVSPLLTVKLLSQTKKTPRQSK